VAKIVLEIPDELKGLEKPLDAVVSCIARQVDLAKRGGAVQYEKFEERLGEKLDKVYLAGEQAALAALEVNAPRIRINGIEHVRVLENVRATYRAPAGEVPVVRSLYRPAGSRTAPTVDLVSLRSGSMGEGWLPATVRAMAFLMQQGTSREAEATARRLRSLPYSRSSFETVGHMVGRRYREHQTDIEDQLIEDFEIPEETASVSVALDRVSIAIEEAVPQPPEQPSQDARKIQRAFRMAYCGVVTLHDSEGTALHCIRYGCMPDGDEDALVASMARDVATLRQQRSALPLSQLGDGSPENWNLFDRHFDASFGLPYRLIDFWHLIEKLSAAAKVIDPDEGPATTRRWKIRLLNCNAAADEILNELIGSGKEEVAVGGEKPVHDAITYITNNGDRMRYATSRCKGLPIGSGNVEATCKTLVKQRMDRSGSRWKNETGEDILQLRSLALSDRWDEAMNLALRAPTVRVKAVA
jgi:hypothetical protein